MNTPSYGANPGRARARISAPHVSKPVSDGTNETFDRSKEEGADAHALVRNPVVDRVRLDTRGIVTGEESEFLAEGLGVYLRITRRDAGLSQDRLSGLCGLSVSRISKLERGLRRPSVPALKALARILAVPGEVEAMEQHLAGLAGESLRDGAERKKLLAENKNRRKALANLQRSTAAMRGSIRRQEAAGMVVSGTARRFAEQGEEMVRKLKDETSSAPKPASIPGFTPNRGRRRPEGLSSRATLKQLEEYLRGEGG